MRNNPHVLRANDQALSHAHDLCALDLDGVVYIGDTPVDHAASALDEASRAGMRLAYLTNNASKTPDEVARKLVAVGMPARAEDVVTSAQAAADLIAEMVPEGSEVFVIGGRGLEVALREVGLQPVSTPSDQVRAVAQGYGPDMPWRQVIAGAILVKQGLPWVASNTDLTIPTPQGHGPGNGTLVRLVADFAQREPVVAGKPEGALFETTLTRTGCDRPLMVGDRLDTDIEGGGGQGWDTLLVLTGVTGVVELLSATPQQRPSYIGLDLRDLHRPHPAPEEREGEWTCGGWSAAVTDGSLRVNGDGAAQDWWRVVAAAGWQHLDDTGRALDTDGLQPPR